MSKIKADTTTAEVYAGAEMLKSGFEKSSKIFETTAEFGKGNLEAFVESATVAGEGFRTINSEIALFSKKSIEESVAATKALMGAKSVHEAFEQQASFGKMAFGAYVGQIKLLNELIAATAKASFAPVQSRFEALSKIAPTAI